VGKLSDEDREAQLAKWQDWDDELEDQGIKELGSALAPTGMVISGSDLKVREGVNAEEVDLVVGGFYVIEAESMDEAVEVAKGCPAFELEGTVEVRELEDA
jgi:hypothetical protein